MRDLSVVGPAPALGPRAARGLLGLLLAAAADPPREETPGHAQAEGLAGVHDRRQAHEGRSHRAPAD